MTGRQRLFLVSQLGHLNRLVESTQSPSARLSLLSRLNDVQGELENLEPEPNVVSAQIIFNGLPVIKEHGIEASFATQATLDYIDTVYLVGLDSEGLLNSTGRIPFSPERYKMLITGVERGSFGFRLENALREPAAGEAIEKAIQRANEILGATQGEERQARQLLTETPPRIIRPMHSFAKRVADADATCSVWRGEERFAFRQPRNAETLLRDFNPDNKGRSTRVPTTPGRPLRFLGRIQGYLSLSREVQIELVEPWTEEDAIQMRTLTRVSYKGTVEGSVRLDIGNILGQLMLIDARLFGSSRNPKFRVIGVDPRARELRNQFPLHLALSV